MGSPATTSPRYHALDALRGTMMLLGIYLHAAVAYAPDGGWPWKQPALTRLLEPSMAAIHVFRMPLFYVMAGFFAALLVERRGVGAAAVNRTKRIVLPFVLGWAVIFPMVFLLAGSEWVSLPWALGSFVSGRFLAYAQPLHLWFLEYLILLYGLAAVCLPVARLVPTGFATGMHRIFRAVAGAWWGPVVLAVPSFLVLLAMPRAELQDPPGFLPLIRIVVAYAIPFAFGWLLYRNADLLDVWRRRGWVNLLLAMIPLALFLGFVPLHLPTGWAFYVRRLEHSLALWLLIFGVTGVFLRTLDGYNPRLRYLCDSSYFLYIAHMPMLLALQIILAPLAWPPVLKVVVVLVIGIAMLLVLYQWGVRPTAVGALLNGRRVARNARTLALTPAEVR